MLLKNSVAILFACAFLAPGGGCACPDGWITSSGSCYRITDDRMNWEAARQVR